MRKQRVLLLGFALFLAVSAFLVLQNPAEAQECRIIRIMEEKGATGWDLRLEPDTVQVTKGTCVIWINWVPKTEVRVNFEADGKRCMAATEASPHFKQAENCYLTDYMKLGTTSSLRFVDVGTYEYQVEIPDQRKQSAAGALSVNMGMVKKSGKIIVTEK